MRNKGFFWFLTITISIVCLYQISFTFESHSVEKQAAKYADAQVDSVRNALKTSGEDAVSLPNGETYSMKDAGSMDLVKNYYTNAYLISNGDKKVAWNGATYNECKNKSINLGLDLKGGMSVTLAVSVSDVVKNEAVNAQGSRFKVPYEEALNKYNAEGGDFIQLFITSFKKHNPDRTLVSAFYSASNESLKKDASDSDVAKYLEKRISGSLTGIQEVMNRRINQFGVAEPNIQLDENTNRIYIELPGVKDENTVRRKLQSTANLQFFETYDNKRFISFFSEADKILAEKYGKDDKTKADTSLNLLSSTKTDSTKAKKDTSSNVLSLNLDGDSSTTANADVKDTSKIDAKNSILGKYILTSGQSFQNGFSDILLYATENDTAKLSKLLNEPAVKAVYPFNDVKFLWSSTPFKFTMKDKGSAGGYSLHAVKIPESGKAPVGGNDIKKASQSYDEVGKISVSLQMTDRGTERWGILTTANVEKNVAIILDGQVLSSPTVRQAMTDGNASITGNYTLEEAKQFASLLNAGALPAPCKIIDESVIGPTLGEANINAGILSFEIALLVILLYMAFYYGKAGIVADIVLVLNLVFLVGTLASFGAVLSLSGIAGLVLTIGMSVDANVLIFERAREELRAGKGQTLVIKDGFSGALASILDGNITTLLTGIVLKIFGTGPIEGFATTLIIGIVTSVFTAVVVSRLVFEWMDKRKMHITYSTKFTANAFTNINFQFVKNRKKFYILSGVIILIGMASFVTRGLQYGVEFTGGRNFEVKFDKPANIETVNANLKTTLITKDGKKASIETKNKESKNAVSILTNFMQGVPNADTIVDAQLKKGLDLCVPEMGNYEIIMSRSVSSSVSSDLKTSSIYAIIFSLLIIFLYIVIRFGKIAYSAGAILALTHDVIIVTSLFSIFYGILPFNMEIDQAFVAAILTVVGYSINDTVIIFDRIREYLHLYKRKDTKLVINDALNSTLGRTINTSMSIFLVLLAMFILGSDSIRGFVFALMIGVIVGTYSSICIATPIIVDFTKEDKEDKK